MPLQIVRNDITKMHVDAIVNAANESLLGGGGVDGCIHRAAGPELLTECRTLGGCETGGAKLTKGYRLPAKYVIHAVGPRWRGGGHGERALLTSCYRTALALASEAGCESVAFPLISSGIYGYPKDEALAVAVETIGNFLREEDERGMTVYLVIFDRASYSIGAQLFADIEAFIDDRYAEAHTDSEGERMRQRAFRHTFRRAKAARPAPSQREPEKDTLAFDAAPIAAAPLTPSIPPSAPPVPLTASAPTLEAMLSRLDESFSEMLLRKIDESGMTDAACYKRANIDRKLFSKIRTDKHYRPSKPTALAFAIALELPLDETSELLKRAGYALTHASKADIIIEYFIERGNYNIFEINEALFAFDQPLLGFSHSTVLK